MMEQKSKISIVQLLLFLLFSVVAPITYLIVRYGLFTSTTKVNIGLWGIIVFAILIGVISALIKFYLEGMKMKYSIIKQALEGFIKVILPLVLSLVIIILLKDNIEKLVETLIVIIPCEIVAIFVNPLPKWCYENNVEGISNIVDTIFKKTKEGN